MRAVKAARAKVTVAAPPWSRTRRALNAGAGSLPDGPSRLAARVLAVYQVSPRQTAAVTRPNAIQPSARSCTSVKPSQNPRPTIANAGWANSSSDRRPGTTGAFLAAVSEGGSNRSRAARRISRFEAGDGVALACAAAATGVAAAGLTGAAAAGVAEAACATEVPDVAVTAAATVADSAGADSAGAGSARAGSAAGVAAAGRARPRLLVTSR